MLFLNEGHLKEIFTHAREAAPEECCGMLGGRGMRSSSVYRLRNVAADPLVTYEAAPEDLFAAQRQMRERNEELLAIYHSHPRSTEPVPSETDVRLAYYPSAVYLIIGLGNDEPSLRAFRISERERRWEAAEFTVIDG
jgi:[CysO sulfur-carrier protein]-S-L-cysteine hydrolase